MISCGLAFVKLLFFYSCSYRPIGNMVNENKNYKKFLKFLRKPIDKIQLVC